MRKALPLSTGLTQALRQYVNATTSPAGCTLSVNNQVIVTLPDGVPAGHLGAFATAH